MKECPFTEEQLKWLANNLTLDVHQSSGYYGETYCEVSLKLDGEQISYASIDIKYGG